MADSKKVETSYCLANISISNDFLQLTEEDINPDNIDTSDFDCDWIVHSVESKFDAEIRGEFSTSFSSDESKKCVKKVREGVMMLKLAEAAVERLKISDEVKRNYEEIFRENFNAYKEFYDNCDE